MSMNNKIHNNSGHRTVDHALTSHVLTPVKPTTLMVETLSFWFNKYGFFTIKRPWEATS